MALLRVLSGSLELAAAYLMIRWGRVDHAMRINGLLGLVGPTVLLLVSLLGLASLSVHLPWPRLGLIAAGWPSSSWERGRPGHARPGPGERFPGNRAWVRV